MSEIKLPKRSFNVPCHTVRVYHSIDGHVVERRITLTTLVGEDGRYHNSTDEIRLRTEHPSGIVTHKWFLVKDFKVNKTGITCEVWDSDNQNYTHYSIGPVDSIGTTKNPWSE